MGKLIAPTARLPVLQRHPGQPAYRRFNQDLRIHLIGSELFRSAGDICHVLRESAGSYSSRHRKQLA